MGAFILSTGVIFLAELGDKSQLMARADMHPRPGTCRCEKYEPVPVEGLVRLPRYGVGP